MSDFSPTDELRCSLAQACTTLFDVSCDADMVSVGTRYADVILRIAFCYNLDGERCAEILMQNSPVMYDIPVIASACCVQKYINITLNDEYLEHIADIMITKYPKGEEALSYAQQRAWMLSRQKDEFQRVIKAPKIRHAFLELIKCREETAHIAARAFLNADDSLCCYEGMGKIGELAYRILNKKERRDSYED